MLVSCLSFLALLGDAENGGDGVALSGRDGDGEAVGACVVDLQIGLVAVDVGAVP